MGGETPPETILKAFSQKGNKEPFCFFGLPEKKRFFDTFFPPSSRHPLTTYVVTKEVIHMEDPPLEVIRKKKQASLCVALTFLKEGKIDALISSGNTGALVAKAKHELSLFSGISRPALATFIPTKKKPLVVLDVGANISTSGKTLEQFAKMGALLQKLLGIKKPRVAFLNMGEEPFKGLHEQRKALIQLQKETFFSFIGNREGTTIFEGDVDVLVTDGFTGNIFLKTAEGVARFLLSSIEEKLPSDFVSLVREAPSYSYYPGALLLGCPKMVFKCHGNSEAKTFVEAAEALFFLQKKKFSQKWEQELKKNPHLFSGKESKTTP